MAFVPEVLSRTGSIANGSLVRILFTLGDRGVEGPVEILKRDSNLEGMDINISLMFVVLWMVPRHTKSCITIRLGWAWRLLRHAAVGEEEEARMGMGWLDEGDTG